MMDGRRAFPMSMPGVVLASGVKGMLRLILLQAALTGRQALSWWLVLGFLVPHNVALDLVGMKESSSPG